MKRTFLLCFLLVVLLVSGCSKEVVEEGPKGGTGDSPKPPVSEGFTGIVQYLPSVPVDVVPLYQVANVSSCEFSVRDALNYVIGKDFFRISFEADATREDISRYYQDLLEEMDEEWSQDQYSFEGYIDGRRISVSIADWQYPEGIGYPVSIMIGEHPDRYDSKNRYFDSHPEGVVVIYENSTTPHYQYTENYRSRYVRYYTSFFSAADQEEVLDFYRNLYQDKESFTETEDDFAIRMKWQEGDYHCSFQYQKSAAHLIGHGIGFTIDKDLVVK